MDRVGLLSSHERLGRGRDQQRSRDVRSLIYRGLTSLKNKGVRYTARNVRRLFFSGIVTRLCYILHRRSAGPHFILINAVHKSGSVWLTELLASVMSHPVLLPERFTARSPREIRGEDIQYISRRRAIVKIHILETNPTLRSVKSVNGMVIFLYRDLRDVARSYIRYIKSYPNTPGYNQLVEYINSTGLSEIDYYIDSGMLENDMRHLQSWLNCDDEAIVFVKYEDLKSNPRATLESVLSQLGKSSISINESKNLEDVEISHSSSSHRGEGCQNGWFGFGDRARQEMMERSGELLLELGYQLDD